MGQALERHQRAAPSPTPLRSRWIQPSRVWRRLKKSLKRLRIRPIRQWIRFVTFADGNGKLLRRLLQPL
jgi:hypothetical protein